MGDGINRVQEFETIPSASEFTSQIESLNLPVVFRGCIKDWSAFTSWNPSNGGFEHLLDKAGSLTVEAMLSRSAPLFRGDIGSHERVSIPFSAFIALCKQQFNGMYNKSNFLESDTCGILMSGVDKDPLFPEESKQIYLAQVSIVNTEGKGRVQLEPLKEDIQMPVFLDGENLSAINLWMNHAPIRSSIHYDPHNNLLCIVSGCKQVHLWPPSACSLLYPMPIYGESSNHSSVPVEGPDSSLYPRSKNLMKFSRYAILQAGDALFIPEGWFHQVDSDSLTIAINFWWRSEMMSSMLEHMDAYYLRRILKRLIDGEMNEMLDGVSSLAVSDEVGHNLDMKCKSEHLQNSAEQKGIMELDPQTFRALGEIVSIVHDHVGFSDHIEVAAPDTLKDRSSRGNLGNLFHVEDDPVAKILWFLPPRVFQNVILAMAHNFPRTLEALVMHLLSPVGAEVMTRRFEEMDKEGIQEEDSKSFYRIFYGVFDDESAAMDMILHRKEAFAYQAFKNVLDKYVGINMS